MKKDVLYKQESRRFFNKVYNKKHGNSEKLDTSILGRFPPRDGEVILDLGCGDGRFLEKISKLNSNVELCGVDISENMILAGRDRNIENCILAAGDAEELSLATNSIDKVYCLNSFHHYPNPQKVAKELKRILKPGGLVVVGEVYVFPGLREAINLLLPYGWTGDYKMYSKKTLNKPFKGEEFINIDFSIIAPFLFTSVYLIKK